MKQLNRINASDVEDVIKSNITSLSTTNESLNTRTHYFGQVIDNNDPENLNRIKVRIPAIDEVYYVNRTKDEGDRLLPWCVPFSNRFLDVPEVNSIVMVVTFDTKVPYFGRMYFDTFSDFSSSGYFEKLTPEQTLLSNWDLIEDIFGINIHGKPKTQGEFNSRENINYKTGIRGKGRNRVLLDKDNIEILQNQNDRDKESKIKVSENIDVDSSDIINITSKKGRKQTYNPVFDDPLFEYLSAMNHMFKKIITLLNTIPAISPSGPCMPAKDAKTLINELNSLSKKFEYFKRNGSSERININ